LSRRAEILAKTHACVTCCDINQWSSLLWNGSFELVILCHTLLISGVRRSCLIADIYRRWPEASVLQVVRGHGKQAAATGLDTSLLSGDPSELVQATVKLLGKPPQEEWLSIFEGSPTEDAA